MGLEVNQFFPVFAVAVAVLVGGCERWDLEPNEGAEDLRVSGTLDGVPFEWTTSTGALELGLDAGGSWCAMPVQLAGQTGQLEFKWIQPSGSNSEEDWSDVLVEGPWPLHAANWDAGNAVYLELDDAPDGASCWVNGVPWDPSEDGWYLDPTAGNELLIEYGEGACEGWTTFMWDATSSCQSGWIEESFDIEWEDDAWRLKPPSELDTWAWTVNGGEAVVQQEDLVLPELDGTYTVALTPPNPEGEYGAFTITRHFAADSEEACDEDEVKCDVEAEGSGYLEVRFIGEQGATYVSSAACDAPDANFSAHAVEAYAESAQGWATRLVRFDCHLALSAGGGDALMLEIASGQIAFPISD